VKRQAYFENGKPTQSLSYCAFLDILGFRERILAGERSGGSDELFQRFHSILENRLKALSAECRETHMEMKSFSDNVLIASPAISPDMEFEFALIMWSLRAYQLEMALEGLFVRGGLSVGKLFVGPDNVYGKALIDAYELESKVSVYPIVTLSDEAMLCVNEHLKYYAGDFAPQLRDVLVTSEGRYFINYLRECIIEGDEEESLDVKKLVTHRTRIEEALKESQGNDRVHAKYSWLACYHNYFCESVKQLRGYKKSMLVGGAAENVLIRSIRK
jgi:hypothetical protein